MPPMSGRTIGVVAGSGIYPQVFIEAAREKSPGIRLVGAAFTGETREDFDSLVDEAKWFRVGQVWKVIRYMREHGVTEAVMIGQIAPSNLFNLRPDMKTLLMIAKLERRNAESLFGGIADMMKEGGITLLPATTFLEDALPAAGHVAGPAPKARDESDADYGFHIAKESSRLDIGQSVVVRRGTVLAVEAFEGTNDCIRRGGALGKGKHITLVKVSKPNQDFRFDVPVIGPDTIKNCAESGIHQIVVEADCTLLLDATETKRLCAEKKVTLLARGSV